MDALHMDGNILSLNYGNGFAVGIFTANQNLGYHGYLQLKI